MSEAPDADAAVLGETDEVTDSVETTAGDTEVDRNANSDTEAVSAADVIAEVAGTVEDSSIVSEEDKVAEAGKDADKDKDMVSSNDKDEEAVWTVEEDDVTDKEADEDSEPVSTAVDDDTESGGRSKEDSEPLGKDAFDTEAVSEMDGGNVLCEAIDEDTVSRDEDSAVGDGVSLEEAESTTDDDDDTTAVSAADEEAENVDNDSGADVKIETVSTLEILARETLADNSEVDMEGDEDNVVNSGVDNNVEPVSVVDDDSNVDRESDKETGGSKDADREDAEEAGEGTDGSGLAEVETKSGRPVDGDDEVDADVDKGTEDNWTSDEDTESERPFDELKDDAVTESIDKESVWARQRVLDKTKRTATLKMTSPAMMEFFDITDAFLFPFTVRR